MVALLGLIHVTLLFLNINPGIFGIGPRSPEGLVGILTSPFVHGDWAHLLSNAAPMFVFVAAILYFYRKAALSATLWIWLMTGIWVWIVGQYGSHHIGASGLIYGFAAFLFFSGVFRKDIRSMALSLVIAFFYGGMVWGVLPAEEGVSWESHLFGFIAGTLNAWYHRKVGKAPQKKYSWELEPESTADDANAVWNYRENWPGGQTIILPGEVNEGPSH